MMTHRNKNNMASARGLLNLHKRLLAVYGPQGWWPAETPFEVCVGALLTQNTSWGNASRAIENLRLAAGMELASLLALSPAEMETLVRPSGYFRQKGARLRIFLEYMAKREGDDWLVHLRSAPLEQARDELLALHGVGPETADSILLYAADRPTFVIDKYTLRFGARYGLFPENTKYGEARAFFMGKLPEDPALFNEFHALIVRLGAEVCGAKPLCGECPLMRGCRSAFT